MFFIVRLQVKRRFIYVLALTLLMLPLGGCHNKSPAQGISTTTQNEVPTTNPGEPLDQSGDTTRESDTSDTPKTSPPEQSTSESTNKTNIATITTPPNESGSSTASEALLYYVRASWDDPGSQTGAFAVWENAVSLATEKGQCVFDPEGKLLYTAPKPTPELVLPSPTPTDPPPTPTATPLPTLISPSINNLPNTRYGWSFPPADTTVSLIARYGVAAYGPAENNSIYLTFNAGYEHNQNSVKILDILARHQVKAVFFVDGYYMETNPATVCRMVEEGHVVGNHTRRHADLIGLLDSGNESAALAQVKGFDDLYRSITGYEPSQLYRPPSSEWSERSLAFVQNLGYRIYLFSWSHKDWLVDDQPEAEPVLQKMKSQVFPGSTLMLHSVSDTNVAILEAFIVYVKEQGYQFALLP